MRRIVGIALKTVLVAITAAMVTAPAAHAVVVPFGDTIGGTDPLGHKFQASNAFKPSWGSPGLGAGTLTFNPGNFSNSNGTFATNFDFIFLKGVAGAIDTTPPSSPFGFELTTRFVDITKGQLWQAEFVSAKEVHFIAPPGSRIDAGDQFFVNITFTGPVDLKRFSFAALWDDTVIPEPATLALVGSGLLGLGLVRRRKAA
ncbi:MAG TPA: PEP-CTERM sorting domain-containing protein [Stellaceae bacterium]|jgi:hypothetical protein